MIDQGVTEGGTGATRAAPPADLDRFGSAGVGPASTSAIDTFEATPIGAYLSHQRILRGVSIEELASITRIPLRSLERLERGEFDEESDGFVRGFVRTVALALGLDADDTVARMLQEPVAGVWERRSSGRRLRQGLVLGFLALALVVMFWLVQAGWRVFAGGPASLADREIVYWRDPVRGLAEATGLGVESASRAFSTGQQAPDVEAVTGSSFAAPSNTPSDGSR